MKVVDSDLREDDSSGKIVGGAWWQTYLKDRTQEELDAAAEERTGEGHSPDINIPCMEAFYEKFSEYQKEVLGGRAHVFLHLLTVLPEYQRCGVGKMHMEWGVKHADELGLPMYVESSPAAKGLYLQYGFEVVREMDFDARPFGLDRDMPHFIMLRPAKA
jgi:GNAT superfamily N-acetyltransferase